MAALASGFVHEYAGLPQQKRALYKKPGDTPGSLEVALGTPPIRLLDIRAARRPQRLLPSFPRVEQDVGA